MKPSDRAPSRLVSTAEIVAAYLVHSPVRADAIPTVIAMVYGALRDLERPLPPPAPLRAAAASARLVATSTRSRRPREVTVRRRLRERPRVVAAKE